MKHRIQSTTATIVLIFTAAAPPLLHAQTAAAPQSATHGKDTLQVPKITVESGRQAAIQINGSEYTVTPTIVDGRRIELRAAVTRLAGDASLVSLDAVAATDIKVLAERIERTILLRAFEKVVNELCQMEFEFSDEPFLGEEANKHAKRVELQNAKRVRLLDLRERLRREMLEETGKTSVRK